MYPKQPFIQRGDKVPAPIFIFPKHGALTVRVALGFRALTEQGTCFWVSKSFDQQTELGEDQPMSSDFHSFVTSDTSQKVHSMPVQLSRFNS